MHGFSITDLRAGSGRALFWPVCRDRPYLPAHDSACPRATQPAAVVVINNVINHIIIIIISADG